MKHQTTSTAKNAHAQFKKYLDKFVQVELYFIPHAYVSVDVSTEQNRKKNRFSRKTAKNSC